MRNFRNIKDPPAFETDPELVKFAGQPLYVARRVD